MELPSGLIDKFVKITKDTPEPKKETTVYGTTVEHEGVTYVKLDGSELLTPITSTADTKPGERVTVMIKNHTATITGNISSPAARTEDVQNVTDSASENASKITEFEIALGYKADVEELNASNARIDELVTENVIVKRNIDANSANIDELRAADVTITQQLNANTANIENLETTKISTEIADAKYATIENLEATNADVNNLEATYGDFRVLTTEQIAAINASIAKLEAGDISVEQLKATFATIENLNTTNANVTDLEVTFGDFKMATTEHLGAVDASIEELQAGQITTEQLDAKYATITNLNVEKGRIDDLEADIADIDTLIFGSATGDTIQTSFSNAVIGQLGNAQIKSAMIESIVAGKITSGDIITNNVKVKSQNGQLLISDETMQISDNTRVRVQIGKDASGDYSINVWDTVGNLMFSKGGITDSAIKDAIIRNDMVSDTANIAAHKLDIDSLFDEINGSINTIKSSRVYLDDKKQTLDVAFGAITTEVDDLKETTSSQGTQLSVLQGQVASKIWQQDIETAKSEIGEATDTLSTQYETIEQELDGVSATVANHTSQISKKADSSTVTAVSDRVTSVEQDLDGLSATVQSNTSNIAKKADSSTVTTVSNKVSSLETNLSGFKTTVSDTYATKTALSSTDTKATNAATAAANAQTSANTANSEVSSLKTRVGTAETSINQNKNDIALRATKTEVDTAVKNVSIGGRNLFIDSRAGEDELTLNNYQGVGGFTQFHDCLSFDPSETIGETYTVSFWAKSPNGSTPLMVYNNNGNPRYFWFSTQLDSALSTEWKYYTYTFTNTDRGASYTATYNRIEIYASAKLGVLVKKIKIERGNKATDWTPAPELMATNADLNSVETRVTSAESSITLLDNKVTTNVTETNNLGTRTTNLEVTASGLTTRLGTAESNITTAQSTANTAKTNAATAQTTANNALARTTVKDTRSDNQPPAWYITNYPLQTVVEFKYCSVIGLSGATYCSLETVVPWSNNSGGYPRQTGWVGSKQYWRVGQNDTTWSSWMAASETATNYLNFSNNGLVVGNHTASTLGRNVLIDSDSVDIRNGANVLASFGENLIDLGKKSATSKINLCGGAGVISAEQMADTDAFDATRIDTRKFSTYSEELFQYTSSDHGKSTNDAERAYTSFTARSLNGTTPESSALFNAGYFNTGVGQASSSVTTHSDADGTYILLNAGTCPSGGAWTEGEIKIVPGQIEVNGDIKFDKSQFKILGNDGREYFSAYAGGITHIGLGSYQSSQDTYLYGDDVILKPKKGEFRPYFRAGDSLEFTIRTAGYVTNSMTEIHFHIPLTKPILGSPTITASSVSGIISRQENKYTHGSTASVYAKPTSYEAWKVSETGIAVKAVYTTTTNALNNAPCGVCWSGKITFS